MHAEIEQGEALHFEGIGRIAITFSDITDTAADAETFKRRIFREGVVEPEAGGVPGRAIQFLAVVHTAGDLAVHVGIGRPQVEPVCKACDAFQFEAPHMRLVHLLRHPAHRRRDVLLFQIVDRRGKETVKALWLIFDARFPLFARGRFRRITDSRLRHRLEGGRVADIRRDAAIEEIADADTARQLVVVLVERAVGRSVERRAAGACPILPQTGGDPPVLKGHLVLRIKTDLGNIRLHIGIKRARGETDRPAINRIDGIERRRGPELGFDVIVEIAVIQPDKQGVVDWSRGELRLQAVVDVEGVQQFILERRIAADEIADHAAAGRRHAERPVGPVEIGITRILPEGEGLVETVLELIADIGELAA
ncbi:hypothetical protein D3C80_876790 [compost metagenome]